MAPGGDQTKTLSDFKPGEEGESFKAVEEQKSQSYIEGADVGKASQDMSIANVSRIDVQEGAQKDISEVDKSRTDDQAAQMPISSNTSNLNDKNEKSLNKSKSNASKTMTQRNLDMEIVRGESHSINDVDKTNNAETTSENLKGLDTAKFNLEKEGQLLRDRGEVS